MRGWGKGREWVAASKMLQWGTNWDQRKTTLASLHRLSVKSRNDFKIHVLNDHILSLLKGDLLCSFLLSLIDIVSVVVAHMKHGQSFKTAVSQCARAPTPHSSKCFVSDSVFSTLESFTFRDTMSLIKSFQVHRTKPWEEQPTWKRRA